MQDQRVYVRRRGRLTRAQSRALDQLSPDFCVEPSQLSQPDQVFGRQARLVVEIGFGMGSELASLASAHPDCNFLGIDVYRPGIGALLNRCAESGLNNVRIIDGDARSVIEHLPDGTASRFCVYFPDPWPKKRHRKRRLIQAPFVALLAGKLEPAGHLQLATDWQAYAEQMLEVVAGEPLLRNRYGAGCFAPRNPERPVTRFEARGQSLGHEVWDLDCQRV